MMPAVSSSERTRVEKSSIDAFRENDSGYDYDWHHAPQRQLIVLLDGEIEIETSFGERRRFRGGEIILVEDTHGAGHRTRSITSGPRRSLFIPLPPGVLETDA